MRTTWDILAKFEGEGDELDKMMKPSIEIVP